MSSAVLKCDVCDKEFSSKSTLSTHKKTAKFCLAKKAALSSQPQTSQEPVKVEEAEQPKVVEAEKMTDQPKDGNFTNEMKRYYEDKLQDREQRISFLEDLIEKMEAKIDRYQITIMSLALKTFAARRGTPERCTNPECEGCRTEDVIERTLNYEMNKL